MFSGLCLRSIAYMPVGLSIAYWVTTGIDTNGLVIASRASAKCNEILAKLSFEAIRLRLPPAAGDFFLLRP